MLDNLEDVIESILFVAGEAVDISDICSKIDVTKSEVCAAANKLQNRYDKNNGVRRATWQLVLWPKSLKWTVSRPRNVACKKKQQ